MKKLFLLALTASAAALLAADVCEGLDKSRFFGQMGEMVEAPENTLRAYRFAIDNGFAVEIDLFSTKDGELIAVIAAAIAMAENDHTGMKFRVVSFKRR